MEITYLQPSLNISTVLLAKGHKAVSLFVNDTADAEVSSSDALGRFGILICDPQVLKALKDLGVQIIALRVSLLPPNLSEARHHI